MWIFGAPLRPQRESECSKLQLTYRCSNKQRASSHERAGGSRENTWHHKTPGVLISVTTVSLTKPSKIYMYYTIFVYIRQCLLKRAASKKTILRKRRKRSCGRERA